MIVGFGILYLTGFRYFLRFSIVLSDLLSLSLFGFIYVYFIGFATWEALPQVKVFKRVLVVRKGFPLDFYPVTILRNSWF